MTEPPSEREAGGWCLSGQSVCVHGGDMGRYGQGRTTKGAAPALTHLGRWPFAVEWVRRGSAFTFRGQSCHLSSGSSQGSMCSIIGGISTLRFYLWQLLKSTTRLREPHSSDEFRQLLFLPVRFSPPTVHILFIWLAGRTPAETTWVCP